MLISEFLKAEIEGENLPLHLGPNRFSISKPKDQAPAPTSLEDAFKSKNDTLSYYFQLTLKFSSDSPIFKNINLINRRFFILAESHSSDSTKAFLTSYNVQNAGSLTSNSASATNVNSATGTNISDTEASQASILSKIKDEESLLHDHVFMSYIMGLDVVISKVASPMVRVRVYFPEPEIDNIGDSSQIPKLKIKKVTDFENVGLQQNNRILDSVEDLGAQVNTTEDWGKCLIIVKSNNSESNFFGVFRQILSKADGKTEGGSYFILVVWLV